MGEIKRISIKKLREKSTGAIIEDLRTGKYSLLDSLDCHDVKREMEKVGKQCRSALKLAEKKAGFYKGDYRHQLRQSVIDVLNWSVPSNTIHAFPHIDQGLIIGYNHSTLGEIFRLISICLREYPERKILFPIDIILYEELVGLAPRMEVFGLYIAPVISQKTRDTLADLTNYECMIIVDSLMKGFDQSFLIQSGIFVHERNVVVVAPSTSRQKTVFTSAAASHGFEKIEAQTMTSLAISLSRTGQLKNCCFVPVAVIPPHGASRGLNLFKIYDVVASDWIPPSIVKDRCKERSTITGDRKFEHYFLNLIADELRDTKNGSRLVSP